MRPVHPRACGEHQLSGNPTPQAFGSSPRVRGTRRATWPCCASSRFIPARAGNTCLHYVVLTTSAVHPRACGEHFAGRNSAAVATGSSPRVRGTPAQMHGARAHRRFIPARAGNTLRRRCQMQSMPVHPRACGEHDAGQFMPKPADGSSPRVRGTPPNLRRSGRASRFIPARAGNTPVRMTGGR